MAAAGEPYRQGGANKKGIKLCQRHLPARCEDVKKKHRRAAHKQPRPLETLCPSTCAPPFFQLQPDCDAFHQERSTDIPYFLFLRSKKSIQVSGDFPVRFDSESGSPSGCVDLHSCPTHTSRPLNCQTPYWCLMRDSMCRPL